MGSLLPLVIRIKTEDIIKIRPITTVIVNGSPINVIPITMAVSGSKAPRMATLAESISVRDRTRVTLLTVVGTNPNRINDKRELPSLILSIPPVVKLE